MENQRTRWLRKARKSAEEGIGMKKVHYLVDGKEGKSVCGTPIRSKAKGTANIQKVTCQMCLKKLERGK